MEHRLSDLVARNALFVVNHSGGKDSQAMLIKVREMVPEENLLIVHARLPGVEWDGVVEHVHRYAGSIPVVVCEANKSLLGMVEERGMWPSPQYRQCTSDLKRGPIEKAIRHYLKDHPEHGGLVVNCVGLRAEESSNRAKAVAWKHSARNSKAGREWYEWLPIHDMLVDEVFQSISDAGERWHWAYDNGMSRLSCCFCIMSSKSDLKVAAKLNPGLFEQYVNLEKKIGHAMMMPPKGKDPVFLEEYIGVKVPNEEPAALEPAQLGFAFA